MASSSFLPSLAAVYYPGSSTFDELDRDDLRYTYGVEDDTQVIIPTGIHQFFNPPNGSSTFFKEQFVTGLRLPIHPFFSDICRYFRIPLGGSTPSSERYGTNEVWPSYLTEESTPPLVFDFNRWGFTGQCSAPICSARVCWCPTCSLGSPLSPTYCASTSADHPCSPRAARPPRPAAPARPRAPRTARPTTSTPLQSVNPPRATYIPGLGLGGRCMGLGGGTSNVSFASPVFREASQATRRARSTNDRLSQDAPSPSRHRARSPSDDSDSDDQPLAQRRRRRASCPVSDSGPSSIPSPPPTAAASPPPPSVTLPPIPSHVNDPPIPSNIHVEPPLAQPSTQQPQGGEAGPSECPSVTPPAAHPPGPSSAPSDSTADPSAPPGLAVGPSEPSPLTYHCYYTSIPSEGMLWSRTDVLTSSLEIKGRLATLWEESIQHMDSLPPLAQMDKFAELYIKAYAESLAVNNSFHATHHQNKVLRDQVAELELQLNDLAQASHPLRAEIKDLTKKNTSLEVSVALANRALKVLQEEQSQVNIVHQQSIDQQTLEHQRDMEQLTQKLRTAETLAQEQDKKLKSQEAQLTSQAVELTTARKELAQARATTEGVSTALAIYRDGENDRCL
ncbi:formin-1-like [Zingiber officinale]|uniref:formin-1-like n=1 Tax=Zingiber officinale TaxID=94328 RepID=UPI001C4ADF6D|nr:formin-1-like [Zingiber officinale]